MGTKIALIGGGALRTLGVICDWAGQGEVAEGSEIVIMDLDARRAGVVRRLAERMPELRGRDIRVSDTTSLKSALDGADFVVNLIRVGGVPALEVDKRIGAAYGFHGHDDFGPSGAMLTLRTVPAVLKIAREMEARCPDAWLLNFSNPVPFLVRAVAEYTSIRVMGLCGGDKNQVFDIPTTLGWDDVPCLDLKYRGVGLDHFSWSTELTFKGEDFYPTLRELAQHIDRNSLPYYCRMSLDVLDLYGQWLSSSAHCFHWTHHAEMLAQIREHFAAEDAGAEAIRSVRQDRDFDQAEACLATDLGDAYWQTLPLKNMRNHPAWPALAAQTIGAMLRDAGEEFMVNVYSPGTVDNLPDDGVLLLTCGLHRDGPRPLSFAGVPEGIAPLTRQILAYQGALVHAAVEGGRRDLEAALLMDPMQRDVNTLRAMLAELLPANAQWLRQELLA
ncbi:MAG: family 4 glycosyl hydrolase [Armatimonadota bacterium]